MAREAVIVEAVRTAIGKRNGALAQAHAADLSGQVLRERAIDGIKVSAEIPVPTATRG